MTTFLVITEFRESMRPSIISAPYQDFHEVMARELREGEHLVDRFELDLPEDAHRVFKALSLLPDWDDAFKYILGAAYRAGRKQASAHPSAETRP